jgi:regulatory protein
MNKLVLQAALVFLARREHSAAELTQKLVRKGYARSEVIEVVLSCQQQGYQSDVRFTELLCRTRIAQGYGPLKISHELRQHQVEPVEAEAIFESQQVDWYELADSVLKKHDWRFKSSNPATKKMRFLMARGFSVDVIRSLLNREKCV